MRGGIPGLLGVVLVWGVLSTACRAPRDEAPVLSQEAITVYTTLLDEEIKTYLAAFQAVYPTAKVKIVQSSTGPLVSRLVAERYHPRADVLWGVDVTNLVLLEWHDMLVPYTPAGLARMSPQFYSVHRPPYWVGISARMLAFCVNLERLAQYKLPLPVAWRDLSNPAYKGHLVLPNPTTSGTGYLVLDTVLQHYGKVEGWEYLDALHQNVMMHAGSGAEPCRLAGLGEATIGVTYGMAGLQEKSTGVPIEVIFPSDVTGWDMVANALVKRPALTIKPAAKAFLDWAISDSAMQAYGKKSPLTAVRTNIAPMPGFPNDLARRLFDKDMMWSAAHHDSIIREWQRRYGNRVDGNKVASN